MTRQFLKALHRKAMLVTSSLRSFFLVLEQQFVCIVKCAHGDSLDQTASSETQATSSLIFRLLESHHSESFPQDHQRNTTADHFGYERIPKKFLLNTARS